MSAPAAGFFSVSLVALVVTQLWVMLGWVFFRCDSADQAVEVLAAIFGLRPHPGAAVLPVEGCILAVIVLDHTLGSACSLTKPLISHRAALAPAMAGADGDLKSPVAG